MVAETAADVAPAGRILPLVNDEHEITTGEAADLLGVTREHIDRLVANDVLPARHVPGSSSPMIPTSAVDAHRERQQRKLEGIRTIVEIGSNPAAEDRDSNRRALLDQMVSEAEDAGYYD